jgi:selenocysteine lyase/cysteine desulfurase
MAGRVPTYLLNVDGVPARDVAHRLAERGYGVWHHDNWYSLGLHPRLPYDGEAVRIGIAHYNTPEEVDGLLAELAALAR